MAAIFAYSSSAACDITGTVMPSPCKAAPTAAVYQKKNGNLLGKYQIGRLLGRGSFAKVYSAAAVNGGDAVAVKVIDKARTEAAGLESRVLNEVDAMHRLHHPHILRIHEVMATKSKIFLIMEFASGGDIAAELRRRRRMPETVARRYFRQLVSALRYCHENGVSHRDIKPHNLLVDGEGNLKLSDFGLSAAQGGDGGLSRTSCGTPAYTAPEVVLRRGGGGGYDGAKADAWSCGVLLFVLLTGNLPFDDSSMQSMYSKILRREFSFPEWVSPRARSVVLRLLDPNPDTRIGVSAVAETSWMKRAPELAGNGTAALEGEKVAPLGNAFDIICMSRGLDLSGMLEREERREKRFVTAAEMGEVGRRVREEAARLGYWCGGGAKGGGWLRIEKEGRAMAAVEVIEVAPSVLVVEMKGTTAVGSGGGMGEEEWEWLGSRLGDLIPCLQKD